MQHPEGIDMGTEDKIDTTAIVSTNLLPENINARKTRANCASTSPGNPTLFTCAANDHLDQRLMKLSSTY
jgi:hypothetical protein